MNAPRDRIDGVLGIGGIRLSIMDADLIRSLGLRGGAAAMRIAVAGL